MREIDPKPLQPASNISLPVIGLIMVTASAIYTGFSWWQSELANVRATMSAELTNVRATVSEHTSRDGHPGVLAKLASTQQELTALHEKIRAGEAANIDQHQAIYHRVEALERMVEILTNRLEEVHGVTIKNGETLRLFEAYHPWIKARLNHNQEDLKYYGEPESAGPVR